GRPAEARPHLQQALQIAGELPSPVGELRAAYYLGEMHEALGETTEAVRAFRRADELGTTLGMASFQKAARDALQKLTAQPNQ
ncbi:MAG: tetratricopeptide repeat protein, partial [bacterium]|nr:tetratricopeptide repeat protein [bacterium]